MKDRSFIPLNIAVLTVSDTRTTQDDLSIVQNKLRSHGDHPGDAGEVDFKDLLRFVGCHHLRDGISERTFTRGCIGCHFDRPVRRREP